MKQRGEHALNNMVQLPLPERIQAEVWGYVDEYKAPMSQADLSVELETRGKNDSYQEATEQYAHANDSWLPELLEKLVQSGKLRKSEDGGYLPPEGYKQATGDS